MTISHTKYLTLIALFFACMPAVVSAMIPPTVAASETTVYEPTFAFKKVIHVPAVDTPVPTVVEVPLPQHVMPGEYFLVSDPQTNTYTPSQLHKTAATPTPMTAVTLPEQQPAPRLVDRTLSTYHDFPSPAEGAGSVTLLLTTQEPITTTALQVRLAQFVAAPLTVELQAGTSSDTLATVIAERPFGGTQVSFPEVTANIFLVTFTHIQPLRITELSFIEQKTQTGKTGLRFLAAPQTAYNVYLDADRPPEPAPMPEMPNLYRDDGVLELPSYPVVDNPRYIPADADDDGITDAADNCVNTYNPDQTDVDKNGRGDKCDDYDRDGRINSLDNCVNHPNRLQRDEDGDGIGDACDSEESRFTERNPWVPWVGLGTAAAVIALLFMMVLRQQRQSGVDHERADEESQAPPETEE